MGHPSLQVRTMNIRTKEHMNNSPRGKQLWIGLVEVRPIKGTEVLTDAKGAFTNLVAWAFDAGEYRRSAELVLKKLGLHVLGVESVEPVSIRKEREGALKGEIEEMIDRAENNPNAVIYGTFHTWKWDET